MASVVIFKCDSLGMTIIEQQTKRTSTGQQERHHPKLGIGMGFGHWDDGVTGLQGL